MALYHGLGGGGASGLGHLSRGPRLIEEFLMIYEFRCQDCGREESLDLPLNERHNPPPCDCGGSRIRIYRPPTIRFKGKGFHINDYPKS